MQKKLLSLYTCLFFVPLCTQASQPDQITNNGANTPPPQIQQPESAWYNLSRLRPGTIMAFSNQNPTQLTPKEEQDLFAELAQNTNFEIRYQAHGQPAPHGHHYRAVGMWALIQGQPTDANGAYQNPVLNTLAQKFKGWTTFYQLTANNALAPVGFVTPDYKKGYKHQQPLPQWDLSKDKYGQTTAWIHGDPTKIINLLVNYENVHGGHGYDTLESIAHDITQSPQDFSNYLSHIYSTTDPQTGQDNPCQKVLAFKLPVPEGHKQQAILFMYTDAQIAHQLQPNLIQPVPFNTD